jgi:surface polysaccharide O-acyltransferase-like enzyme
MLNSQNRIFGYDLIKTIAIFMIVFYHLGGIEIGTIEPGQYFLPNFNQFVLSICAASVPLFLMVHGALILPKQLNLKDSILKAIKMVLLFLFGKVVLQRILLEKCFSIGDEMVHFWFLGTLGMVYGVSYFLNKWKWLRHFVLLILIIYPFLSNLLVDCVVFFKPGFNFLSFGHDGFYTFYALVYFYLGYHLKHKTITRCFSLLAITAGVMLINFEVVSLSNYYQMVYDGVNGSFPTIGAIALSTGLFLLLKDTNSSNCLIRDSISFIGSNTMGVYLFHVLVIFLLRKYEVCESLGMPSSIMISCIIILVIALFSHFIKIGFESLLNYHNYK